MNITCPCHVCSQPVEFDSADAGKSTVCPHCSMETLLFQPRKMTASAGSKPMSAKNLVLIAVVLIVLIAILLSGYLGFISTLVVMTGGIAGAAALLILGAFVLLWAILWIVFPVFMYYGMKRQEKLLEHIERNTRITNQ